MKATEVLQLYADGKRDFSGANLRGASFKGKDISGANFSETDIRGANFTHANLTGTNFRGAKAGIQRRWAIILVISSWILSGLSGILSVLIIDMVSPLLGSSNRANTISNWVSLIALAVFFFISIRKGLVAGFIAVGVTVGIAIGVAVSIAFNINFGITFGVAIAGAVGVGVAGAVGVTVGVTVAIAGAKAVARVIVGVVAFVGIVVIAGVAAIAGVITGAVAVTRVVAGAMAGARAMEGARALMGSVAGGVVEAGFIVGAVVVAVAVILFSIYIGWRALKGDERDAWLRTIAIAIAATGGTSFRYADLTDADFTSATLKNTDFRNANFNCTNLYQTEKLDQARVGNTILSDAKVRDLVVTHRGAKQSYLGCNLQGANLVGANLNEANFREADISGANLQEAWLEGANLKKTHALNTNFNQAHLTGACLEAWNIDSSTQLEQIDCQYVYLLEHPHPQTGSRERLPHHPDKLFQPGDLAKFYNKIMNKVQILFRDGINQKSLQIAFKKIMIEYPDISHDSIQSIEKKGSDILLTIAVPQDTDKGDFERKFLEVYHARLKEQKQV